MQAISGILASKDELLLSVVIWFIHHSMHTMIPLTMHRFQVQGI